MDAPRDNFRRMGPSGLDAYLRVHGRSASPHLDALCAQKDAHTALLYWFTDLRAAIAEARRTNRPILSLRLLGRLDEELSCANSRFFRKLLYVEPRVNRLLRDGFVLHWQSVRPVPKVTLDFGDGRRIERTLTGNSVHLVLDSSGNAVDALPGLFDRDTFVDQLEQARSFAAVDRRELAHRHRHALGQRPRSTPPRGSRAFDASMIAPTKHVVELPVLRAVTPVSPTSVVEQDTAQNLELHRRVHEAFASGAEWAGLDGLVEWIYAELFLMPLSDPTLGLDVPDSLALSAPRA